MKKLLMNLLVLIFFVSCKKENIDITENKELRIEDVGKEFNFDTKKIPKEKILKQYGSLENWRNKIFDMKIKRAKKINNVTTESAITRYLTYKTEYGNFGSAEVPLGITIMDWLEIIGLNMPNCDRVGASGSCAAVLISGMVDQSDQSYLSDCEIEAGYILPCVSYMLSNCEIMIEQEANLSEFYQTYDLVTCQVANPCYLQSATKIDEFMNRLISNGDKQTSVYSTPGYDSWTDYSTGDEYRTRMYSITFYKAPKIGFYEPMKWAANYLCYTVTKQPTNVTNFILGQSPLNPTGKSPYVTATVSGSEIPCVEQSMKVHNHTENYKSSIDHKHLVLEVDATYTCKATCVYVMFNPPKHTNVWYSEEITAYY